ncbi:MAG: heavy-metal-associated domain-containing protein [Gemmatimonadota bacterium]
MKDDCHVEPMEKSIDDDTLAQAEVAEFSVTGMGCINCANRVRNGLLQREGVYKAEIDLTSRVARVRFDASVVGVPGLLEAVAAAGESSGHEYRAQVLDSVNV